MVKMLMQDNRQGLFEKRSQYTFVNSQYVRSCFGDCVIDALGHKRACFLDNPQKDNVRMVLSQAFDTVGGDEFSLEKLSDAIEKMEKTDLTQEIQTVLGKAYVGLINSFVGGAKEVLFRTNLHP